MNFVNSIRSELYKAITSRSTQFTILFTWVFALGATAVGSYWAPTDDPITQAIPFGVTRFIVTIAAIIIAAMSITTEYRFKTQSNTYLATPNKAGIMASKWLSISAILALVAIVGTLLSFIAAFIFSQNGTDFEFGSVLKHTLVYSLELSILVFIVQGVSYVLRNTAAVVTIMIVWNSSEAMVGLIPKIGEKIQPYLLMNNLKSSWSLEKLSGVDHSLWACFAIALVYAAVFFGAGAYVFHRRDV